MPTIHETEQAILELNKKNAMEKLTSSEWKGVWSHFTISIDFLEKYKEKINWAFLSMNIPKLSEELMRKYADELDWPKLIESQQLSETFIQEHLNFIKENELFEQLLVYQKLSETFLVENLENLDWELISSSQTLSPQFIWEYRDRLDWQRIISYQELSAEFLEKSLPYIENLLWVVARYQSNLPEWFIRKYSASLPLDFVFQYQMVSEDFIEEFGQKEHNQLILAYQNVSEEYILRHKDSYTKDDWYKLLENKPVSNKILEESLSKISYYGMISTVDNIPLDFVRKHANRIEDTSFWNVLSKGHKLDKAFVDEYFEKLNLERLLSNPNIDLDIKSEIKEMLKVQNTLAG